MTSTVDAVLIKQYESEVHVAYQRMGSHFRNFVRRSMKTPGQDITFPKMGKVTAQRGRTRAGDLTPLNAPHDFVTCTIAESNAPIYIDKFDQLRTNVLLRENYVNLGAMAIGRDTDKYIVDTLDTVTGGDNVAVNLSDIASDDLINLVVALGAKDVPINAISVTAAVSWKVWGKMLKMQEFANSQWIGPDQLPLKSPGIQAKAWAGALWFPTSALTLTSNVRACYAWSHDAIGHGIGEDVNTEVNYIPIKRSFLTNSNMSQGAVLIDDIGVERLRVAENA